MMRRSAGFHADEAGRQLLKEWQNVPALELTANDYITCRVNSVDLKNRLSDIETDCRNRLHVWLLRIVGASTAPTSMALTRRWRSRPHGVIAGASCPKPITSLGGWLFPDRMEIRAHDWTPGPIIEWRTAMEEYIGLDVSMKETSVSIRRAGERIWRGKCASDPRIVAALIRKRAPAVKRVMFETGPLSVWFYHSLHLEGLPAICIDARHAKAALDMATNKTDANDADGLAQLAEVGFFREVRVKGFDSMLTRTLVAARTRLVRITTELS